MAKTTTKKKTKEKSKEKSVKKSALALKGASGGSSKPEFVDVKTTIYPLEAIYSAAYQFINRAYLRLEQKAKDEVRVHLEPKVDKTDAGFKKIGGEFQNELIHQCVRSKVAESNKKIREYIVTRALLSAQASTEIPAGFPVPGAPGPGGMLENAPGPDGAPNLGPDGKPITNDGAPPGTYDTDNPNAVGPMVDQRDDDPMPGANLDRVNKKATPSDDALAGEIQKLLAEIDKGGEGEDPLGIVAPWEEKSGVPEAKVEAAPEKAAAKEEDGSSDDLANEIKNLLATEAEKLKGEK
jgi:His-Xaa-Ser system protein HxsD